MSDVPLNPEAEGTAVEGKPNRSFCIDVDRVYDSCGDKDCLSKMRVFFTEDGQEAIEQAMSLRIREANIISTSVKVEPVTYHKGFYSVDLTFYFEIVLDLNDSTGCAPNTVSGLSVFCKRVILYGGEGNVAVFTSDKSTCVCPNYQCSPVAKVQVAPPVPLSACFADGCCSCFPSRPIPDCVADYFGGPIVSTSGRSVLATIGLFTIVQLKRSTQVMIPAYDYCIPRKECVTTNDNPCELFSKADFPVDQFYPPNITDIGKDNDCCNDE